MERTSIDLNCPILNFFFAPSSDAKAISMCDSYMRFFVIFDDVKLIFVILFCFNILCAVRCTHCLVFAWWISNLTNTWKKHSINSLISIVIFIIVNDVARSFHFQCVNGDAVSFLDHFTQKSLFFFCLCRSNFHDSKIFVLINVSSATDKYSNRPFDNEIQCDFFFPDSFTSTLSLCNQQNVPEIQQLWLNGSVTYIQPKTSRYC